MHLLFFFNTLFILWITGVVYGQIQATNRRFNITAPVPGSPYVAGQIVPVTYTLPDDSSLSSVLGLAVYFASNDLSMPQATITENADLSQGFSFKRTSNTGTYYEHQLNYGIPKDTKAGNYQIVFVDTKGGGNTSVPIEIRPFTENIAATTTSNTHTPGQASNIFLQGGAISMTPTGFTFLACLCLGILPMLHV